MEEQDINADVEMGNRMMIILRTMMLKRLNPVVKEERTSYTYSSSTLSFRAKLNNFFENILSVQTALPFGVQLYSRRFNHATVAKDAQATKRWAKTSGVLGVTTNSTKLRLARAFPEPVVNSSSPVSLGHEHLASVREQPWALFVEDLPFKSFRVSSVRTVFPISSPKTGNIYEPFRNFLRARI
ncbi:L polymerase protein [Striga asiatica]|uniref:L polymerase protein n=1 Tax=Striga asiatica TaxID=4170 RepID=A0A5A7P1R2_STRAF|nr:L polymerase protein [Striga asiatica]